MGRVFAGVRLDGIRRCYPGSSLRRRAIVTPVSERFETDMRGGYPDDGAAGVTLGSPMREGEVLSGVRNGTTTCSNTASVTF